VYLQLKAMETKRAYDEESLQHIYALLRNHRSSDVIRMVLDVAQARTLLHLVHHLDVPA
jgi:hypothetical protein